MSEQTSISAIIVGASGSIGQTVCKQLAESGGDAFLIGKSLERLKELSDMYGWGFAVADGTDWEQLDGVVSSAEGLLGGINAAINLPEFPLIRPTHLRTRRNGDRANDTYLTSASGLMRSCVPRMVAYGGSVVLMSSATTSIVLAGQNPVHAYRIASLLRI